MCAIKSSRATERSTRDTRADDQEVYLLTELSHENVINLFTSR